MYLGIPPNRIHVLEVILSPSLPFPFSFSLSPSRFPHFLPIAARYAARHLCAGVRACVRLGTVQACLGGGLALTIALLWWMRGLNPQSVSLFWLSFAPYHSLAAPCHPFWPPPSHLALPLASIAFPFPLFSLLSSPHYRGTSSTSPFLFVFVWSWLLARRILD